MVWSDGGRGPALVDDRLRTWLELHEGRWGAEVTGRVAIVYGPSAEHPDVVANLGTLWAFLECLPKPNADDA
jgi:hypothetical protein